MAIDMGSKAIGWTPENGSSRFSADNPESVLKDVGMGNGQSLTPNSGVHFERPVHVLVMCPFGENQSYIFAGDIMRTFQAHGLAGSVERNDNVEIVPSPEEKEVGIPHSRFFCRRALSRSLTIDNTPWSTGEVENIKLPLPADALKRLLVHDLSGQVVTKDVKLVSYDYVMIVSRAAVHPGIDPIEYYTKIAGQIGDGEPRVLDVSECFTRGPTTKTEDLFMPFLTLVLEDQHIRGNLRYSN